MAGLDFWLTREARSISLDAKFGSTKRTKLIRRRRFALLCILQNPGTKDIDHFDYFLLTWQ